MTIKEISEKLTDLKSAMIFCHVRPDGDTLSCAFALYTAFQKLGKKAAVVCSSEVSDIHLSWIPFKPLKEAVQGFDGYITVDMPIVEQLGDNANFFLRQKNTFSIDHHLSNTGYANTYYYEPLPACALVTYKIIKQMKVKIDKTIADYLLIGIMSDTNNFSVSGLDDTTFSVVSELLRFGADFSSAYDKLFRNLSIERVSFFADMLTKVKLYHDGRLAMVTIKKENLDKFALTDIATYDIVDYLLKINTVDVSVSLLEAKNNFYRISFRSKKTNVGDIARIFGGGGHPHASGAVLSGYYEDVVDKLVFNIGNYLL